MLVYQQATLLEGHSTRQHASSSLLDIGHTLVVCSTLVELLLFLLEQRLQAHVLVAGDCKRLSAIAVLILHTDTHCCA